MASKAEDVRAFCRKRFDYVIIGGGTAGLVVAARLSEDPSVTVGVLEAGELGHENFQIGEPSVNYYRSAPDFRYDWELQTEPQSHAFDNIYDWPCGRIAGGSSVTNQECLSRGFKHEYDDWEALGNPGWGWDGLLPYFSKAEAVLKTDDDVENDNPSIERGTAVASSSTDPKTFGHPVWKDAWAELSVSGPTSGPSRNKGLQLMDLSSYSIPASRKNSMTAYYKPVSDRRNLHFLPTVLVSSVKFSVEEGGKLSARAVEFLHFKTRYQCEAKKEVIICAGTVMSPGILERSGIGSKDVLNQHGIETRINMCRVGENLQDHTYCYSLVEILADEELLNQQLKRLELEEADGDENSRQPQTEYTADKVKFSAFVTFEQASMGRIAPPVEIDLDIIRRTPLLRKQHGLAVRRFFNPDAPCYQFMIIPGYASNLFPKPTPDTINNCAAILASVSTPFSRGSVHIESNEVNDLPAIDPQYLEHPLDTRLFRAATKMSMDLVKTNALSNVKTELVLPDEPTLRKRGLNNHARETCETFLHPVGTCAMMPREDGGVVDPNLLVYGTNNLRIVDGSIIPMLVSGNIEWTVYAIAEKAADIIKACHHNKTQI